MSKRSALLLALIVLLQGLTIGGASATTLKIATLVPDGTAWMKAMRQAATEIKARTDGRVMLRFYPGGVMGNSKSVMRKIRAGQLHGSVLTSGALASIQPNIQMYSFPFMFRSYEEVDYVRQRLDQTLIDGLRSRGLVSFGLTEGGFVYLMSSSPISSVAQVRQHKVWTPEGDEIARSGMQAIGISPIPLPITDVLTGLQTGLIDVIGTSPVVAIALQWHTKVSHLTDIPVLYLYGSLTFAEKALKRLSADDREVLSEVLHAAVKVQNAKMRQDNHSARQALLKRGIQLVTPNPAETREWRAGLHKARSQMKNDGQFSAELLQRFEALIAEYRRAHGG